MTSIIVDAAEFKRHVQIVRHGTGASKSDLQVQLIRASVVGNRMTLFAADKEKFIRSSLTVTNESEEPISFALMANKLVDLTGQVESERITLTVTEDSLEVSAGFLTVSLVLFDGASLKQVEDGTAESLKLEGIAIDRAHLIEGLESAKSCIAVNSLRPETGHAELRGGRLLSSDGRKILIFSHDSFDEKVSLKVPAGILNQVTSSMKNMTNEKVKIAEGESYQYIIAGMNQHCIGLRKTERSFPAIEGQIASSEGAQDEVSIDQSVLSTMIKGVAIGIDTDDVRVTVIVDGESQSASLQVVALNSLGKKSHERAICGRMGEGEIKVPVSFKHLLDTLVVFKGDSVVDIYIMDQKKLLMIKDRTDTREVTTLIPFRTDEAIEAEKVEADKLKEARKQTEDPVAVADAVEAETADVDL